MAGYTEYLFPTVNVIQFAFYSHTTSELYAVFSFPHRSFFSNKMFLANPSSTDYANSYCICFFPGFSTFVTFHEYHSALLFDALYKYNDAFSCPVILIVPPEK